mmetsp:Transcript_16963/g.50871  ORF Transcript_16963/g.50871 Transcript_16963/m.50871 type:complete len:192 (-) Transcript_16963:136-711(-)
MTNRHVARKFGASALGSHQFFHRPTKPRQPQPAKAGTPDAGGAGESHVRAAVEAAGFQAVECCGEEFEGYCCRRHHPDDDVVCCSRHQREAELRAAAQHARALAGAGETRQASPAVAKAKPHTTSPAFTFAHAGGKGAFRETALSGVPKGHRLGSQEPGWTEPMHWGMERQKYLVRRQARHAVVAASLAIR